MFTAHEPKGVSYCYGALDSEEKEDEGNIHSNKTIPNTLGRVDTSLYTHTRQTSVEHGDTGPKNRAEEILKRDLPIEVVQSIRRRQLHRTGKIHQIDFHKSSKSTTTSLLVCHS